VRVTQWLSREGLGSEMNNVVFYWSSVMAVLASRMCMRWPKRCIAMTQRKNL
jgi:hypothetical protein